VVTKPDGSRTVSATYWTGSKFEDALNLSVKE
jgi:hypothetical protein